MLIETQITPDVNVINFFPAEKVLRSGTAEFVDAKSLRKSPLTKENNASWDDLKPQILAEIMDFFATGEQAVVENPADRSPENVIREITSLINARIRPAIRQDGGDIVFRSFENGVVYVELQGNCKGCPYALVTLKEGVEKILKTYIPEVKSVENYDKDA